MIRGLFRVAADAVELVVRQLAPVDPCVARPGTYESALVEAEEADEVTQPCQSCRWPDVPAGDDASPQAPPAGQHGPLSELLTRAAGVLAYEGHQRLSAELADRATFMRRIEQDSAS